MDAERNWIATYRRTVEPLYRFVSRRTGGATQLSEDVVQEAYLRGISRFPDGTLPREPLAWLQTIARNLLVSHHRRTVPVAIDPAVLDGVLEGKDSATPDAATVLQAGLARLPRRQAELIEAFHLDGRSVRSIAEERGLSERAVEGRLRRARRILRRRMEPLLRREEPS